MLAQIANLRFWTLMSLRPYFVDQLMDTQLRSAASLRLVKWRPVGLINFDLNFLPVFHHFYDASTVYFIYQLPITLPSIYLILQCRLLISKIYFL